MTTGTSQLTAYAARDAEAYAGVVRGYGALVYSICLRILAAAVALGLTACLALIPYTAPCTGVPAMTQPATARHEGTRVIINGVPNRPLPLTWDQWLAGLQIMLEHRGEKVSMDELTALSGEAFGFCHADRWELRTMLSTANDPLSSAAAALGYECTWMPTQFFWEAKKRPEADRKAIAQQYLAAVRSQIDQNRTVLLGGTHGQCGSWRVVVGYDTVGNKVCFNGGTTPYEWTDWEDPKAANLALFDMQVRGHIRPQFHGGWLPNTAFCLKDKTTNPSPRQRAVATLRQAVALHTAAPFQTTFYGNVTYHFGDDAFSALANDLRALDYPSDIINAEKIKGDFYDMAMLDGQIGLLMQTRPAAAAFCQRGAELLPTARTPLLQASEHYRAITTITKNAFAPFFEPPASIAPVERNPRWRDMRIPSAAKTYLSSAQNRETLAAAVNQIADHERQAVALLQQALATLDSPPSPRQ